MTSSNSFSAPGACGFGRTLAFLLATNKIEDKYDLTVLLQHQYFTDTFKTLDGRYDILYENYKKQLVILKKKFQRFSKDNPSAKNTYLNKFHPANWSELNEKQQKEHSLYNCVSCSVNYMIDQTQFPILCNRYKAKAMENPSFNASNIKIKSTGLLKDITKDVYNNVNKVFLKKTGVAFNDALVKVKEANIRKKKTKLQMKKDLREKYRKQKQFHEDQLNKTAILR